MWFDPTLWLRAEARRVWPYILLALLVALLIITAWFLYHVYFGRLA